MKEIDKELIPLIDIAQRSFKLDEKRELKEANKQILDIMEKFRLSIGRKFGNKGIDFDELIQVLDVIILEAVQDYDKKLDPSPFRHLFSRGKNGIWNYYRKEMRYFNKSQSQVSYDEISKYEYLVVENKDLKVDDNIWIDSIIIRDAINQITPKQKIVLEMYFFEGKSSYEIARELKINQSNVFRRLERGLSALKEILKDN